MNLLVIECVEITSFVDLVLVERPDMYCRH